MGLVWNPAHRRFDGYGSVEYNCHMNKMIDKIEAANQKNLGKRDERDTIRDFRTARVKYHESMIEFNGGYINFYDRWHGLAELRTKQKNNQKDAVDKEFNKFCYVIIKDSSKEQPCRHFNMSKPERCNCSKATGLIDGSLLKSNTVLRSCLSVMIDGTRIDIQDEDSAETIQRKVREKVPMFGKVEHQPTPALGLAIWAFGEEMIKDTVKDPDLVEELTNSFLPGTLGISAIMQGIIDNGITDKNCFKRDLIELHREQEYNDRQKNSFHYADDC